MNQSDLELLASQTVAIANSLINSELTTDSVKLIERYNSSLAQYIQLLETFPIEMRKTIPSAIMVSERHVELENSLSSKQDNLKKLIISLNSEMSLKNKYFKRNIKRTGIDRKG